MIEYSVFKTGEKLGSRRLGARVIWIKDHLIRPSHSPYCAKP